MIRVADYIAQQLAQWHVSHVFTVTGGGAMFLNDAFGFHPSIDSVYQHHEQACAMAAEGYARINGTPGVAIVTTGPGSINAFNGVFGAYTDSIPMLMLSGQVKRETCLSISPVEGLRQLGDQEAKIVDMVKPITKHAVILSDPKMVALELEKAWHIATHGRPGPVWIDIPVDVQSATIDPAKLQHFDAEEFDRTETSRTNGVELARVAKKIAKLVSGSKSPVLMGGTGVRLANAIPSFTDVGVFAGVPIVTAWTHDLIGSDHPLFCGRPGTIGTRQGNFCVQNADLLIVVGSRLNIRQTSYHYKSFAKRAYVVHVDIDEVELNKPTYQADLKVHADAKEFCVALAKALHADKKILPDFSEWLAWCKQRGETYPVVQAHHFDQTKPLNPYYFMDQLFAQLNKDDIVVAGNATACIVPFQTAKIKFGQRLFSNSGSASMGHDLPAALGAYYGALALKGHAQRVICIAGDGSIMMNIQELQTIASHKIPIKIFVLDNGGYLSIRSSQNNFFNRLTGESAASGVSFPDFTKIAEGFGLKTVKIQSLSCQKEIAAFINDSGPGLAHVVLDSTQGFEPRMSSKQQADGTIVSPSLEDMHPFLSSEEMEDNIYRPALQERLPNSAEQEVVV